jgi:hypothetical protein
MLRKHEKLKVFLHLEPVYVKKASKNEALPSLRALRARLRKEAQQALLKKRG